MSARYLATQGRLIVTQVVQILFASHMFLNYGYEIAPVDGPSMLPTIHQWDDFVLIEKWTPLSERGFKVGDIVHGRHPYGNHPVCKRLVGKGGDIIRMDPIMGGLIKVPKGHVWLVGDNLGNSIDSRDYGPVPEATLKGRILARISFRNRPFFSWLPNSLEDVPKE